MSCILMLLDLHRCQSLDSSPKIASSKLEQVRLVAARSCTRPLRVYESNSAANWRWRGLKPNNVSQRGFVRIWERPIAKDEFGYKWSILVILPVIPCYTLSGHSSNNFKKTQPYTVHDHFCDQSSCLWPVTNPEEPRILTRPSTACGRILRLWARRVAAPLNMQILVFFVVER